MPTSSPFRHLDIPNADLWTFLFERKDRPYPDDQILFMDADTKRHYTYADTKESAAAFGQGLKFQWNWKKGDVVALFAANCIDYPVVIWGILWAGGVASPANPAYTVDELALQLKSSRARVVVTQIPMLQVAREAAKRAGIPEGQIVIMGDDRDPEGKVKHFTSIRNISGTSKYLKSKINPRTDMAFLAYSSGTTGLPKGVMLSHTNIVANILQNMEIDGRSIAWNGGPDGKGDRILSFLPFFHIYGLTVVVHALMYGGCRVIVMPKFDLEKWCAHVQNFRIIYSYVVPPIVLLLSKHPIIDKYDLSSLRMLNSGAAPLSRELVEVASTRLKIGVKQGYGLSETSPTTHAQLWGEWDKSMGSIGKLLPNLEAKYMTTSEDGHEPHEAPVGEVGELYMRGPNIFLGYYNNPEATANCLSADGWFRTGDIGYQDKEGNFYITDRAKELIKYKGSQVAPAELEGLLVENEAVYDVAVIGVESKARGTEVPRAYIVRSAKSKAAGVSPAEEAANITNWLHEKIANHKRLRGGIRFVDEIPKTASGKILRRVLKERAREEDIPMAKL